MASGPFPSVLPSSSAGLVIAGVFTNSEFGDDLDITTDLDGDGYLDLIATETRTSHAIYIFYGPVSGSLLATDNDAKLLIDHTTAALSLVAGDLDRDGFVDIGIVYENTLAGGPEVQFFLGSGI